MKFFFIFLLTAGIVSAQSVSSSGGSSGGASSNDFKENVRVATTANITIATALNNGDTLDGVTLATGNRVLVKDQSTPSQNGIYTVSASPARASDSNTWAKIAGSLVAVGSEGTTNRNKIFLNDSAPTGTLGSTSLSYIEKAASGMGSGDALVANPLSQFAATTSNQLLTTLNDETGTGVSVFGTSPTFTTSLLTGSTTFSLFNSTATTLNFGGAATTLNIGSSAATVLNFGGSTSAAQFRFLEPSASGTNYTGFKAQAQAGNVTYTLPAADGTSGQVLSTNGTGTLSWATASGGLTGSAGGNGAADSGKAALFDAGGQITSSDGITILKTTGGYGANFDPDMLTASRAYSLPDASGELATKEWIALQGYGTGSVATDAIWNAKGDLAVGTGANTASVLTAGTNGYVLTADSAEATGLKWAAAGSGSFDATTVDAVTWSDGANASNVWTFNVSGTDPTLTAGSNNFIFGSGSIDLGSAGVRLSQDGDGALTFLGLGNGSDEDLTLNFDDAANEVGISSSTGITALNTGTIGIKASGATSELGPLQTSDGKPLLNDLSVYAAGTAYTLTNTAALVDFGTTDPTKVIDSAGTYLITVRCLVDYSAATVSAETATIKLRRTNNTAADVTGATTTIDLPVATTLTHSYGSVTLPPVLYVTTASDDSLSIFANVSATLGAGSIKISEASIVAVRIR